MSIIASTAPRVNSDIDEPAFEPEVSTPSAEDALWAAETSPFAEEDFDVDDATDYDLMAFESAAMDALERGMIPPDAGPGCLRGLADETAEVYAAEVEKISGTRPAHEAARQAMDVFWLKLATGL
jgi:hypothetical protein